VEKVTLEIGESPLVKITAIGGDLRVSGRDEPILEVQAPDKGKLQVDEIEDGAEICANSGCIIYLPKDARLEVGDIGGDCRVTDLRNEFMIRTIGGDLSLRRVGAAIFETIGGDFQGRQIDGNLTVDRIGGDAVVQKVNGDVHLRGVGGDLMLNDAAGQVNAFVGGDAFITLATPEGSHSKVQAGSDLSCRIHPDSSVNLSLSAGGDLDYPSGVESRQQGEGVAFQLGDGDADIELSAGGDLCLQTGLRQDDSEEDWVGEILTEVDAKLAEVEARFNVMGTGMYGFDADRIGERVRRAVRRAERKASGKAKRKAAKGKRKTGSSFSWTAPGFDETVEPATDEERLTILRMVEEGKVSVSEAEDLLKALEGES
jgi:hypothetical protein